LEVKRALVHDWLLTFGGAERVLEEIYELFKSPIYTLFYDRKALRGTKLEKAEISTPFTNKLPFSKSKYRLYLPLFPFAVEQIDLSDYNTVISSSHAVAKGVLVRSDQLHICYCHTPFRFVWELYHSQLRKLGFLKRSIFQVISHYYRIWDRLSADRVDYFVANSKSVSMRIWKVYRRKAKVIYPPVSVESFEVSEQKEDFYVTVGRLVPYKRIDLIVKAFSEMKNRKLVVIGDGPERERLEKISSGNVRFLGKVPFPVLKEYLKRARAFVFAAEEDFGIAPVEAQACGTPVIAYEKGGTSETVINGKTGILFKKQSTEYIIQAVEEFEKRENNFDPWEIRKNAEKFSKERFKENFLSFVHQKEEEFRLFRRKVGV